MERGHAAVEPAHLLLGLLAVTEESPSRIPEILILAGVSKEEIRFYCEAALPPGNANEPEPALTPAARRAVELTANVILLLNPPSIEPEHLLLALALLNKEPHYKAILEPLGLGEAELLEHLAVLNGPKTAMRHPLKLASPEARQVLEKADRLMRDTFCGRIGTAHLLLALLDESSDAMTTLLQAAEIDVAALRAAVRRGIVQDGELATSERRYNRAAQQVLDRARDLAFAENRVLWEPRHLLRALLPRPMVPNEKLASGADPGDSVSSFLEPCAERLRRVTQSPADGGEEIPDNLRPPGITRWLVPLGLVIAAPLTA